MSPTSEFVLHAFLIGVGATIVMDLWALLPLRANIDETVPPVIISEQGENRNQCEEQRNVFAFSHGFACR